MLLESWLLIFINRRGIIDLNVLLDFLLCQLQVCELIQKLLDPSLRLLRYSRKNRQPCSSAVVSLLSGVLHSLNELITDLLLVVATLDPKTLVVRDEIIYFIDFEKLLLECIFQV